MGDCGYGSDHVKKTVVILDMRGKGFNKGLEVGVDVSRDLFSRGIIGGNDGTTRVTRFVYLGD